MLFQSHARLLGCALLLVGGLLLSGCATMQGSSGDFFDGEVLPETVATSGPALESELLERAIHNEVNRVRQRHGLAALAWIEPVAPLARAHSQDMNSQRYFGHVNAAGEDAQLRAARFGLATTYTRGPCQLEGIGENLYATHRYREFTLRRSPAQEASYDVDWKSADDVVAETVQAWMTSATHRANLLSPLYQGHAIGVVVGDQDKIFVTQNLVPGAPALLADGGDAR